MSHFVSGAIMMGFFVAGLFFFQFWRKTRDVFFLIFSLAFWMLMMERIPLAFIASDNETRYFIYLIRLFAFILILTAVWQKNRNKGET